MSISEQTLSLLRLMSDGEFHSGESLGEILGVSRAAVWKNLQGLSHIGVEISRVRGRGYQIEGGLSLLNEVAVQEFAEDAEEENVAGFDKIFVLPAIESTNKWLLEKISERNEQATRWAVLAEAQSAGRGRRGREWQSPFARSIYLSTSWQFENGVAAMEGLSLAVGVAVSDALDELGFAQANLKWPNDIIYEQSKLGGVLIEILGDASGECHAVVGVGLNVSLPSEAMQSVDQPWTDLARLASGSVPARNRIAGTLLKHLSVLLSGYQNLGFSHYKNRWEARCAHIRKSVVLSTSSSSIEGEMLGVTETGALQLLVDGEEKIYVGGEVSLRESK